MKTREVVISGIGGRYPGADNTELLWKLLLDGQDLIAYDNNATISALDLPKFKGCFSKQSHFDNTLFGIHTRLAEKMDINTCIILEMAFSAIFDAGVNPHELGGKQIPVVIASGVSKYDLIYCTEKANNGFSIVGASQCMMANRLSHILNLKGPSLNVDGSWNGFFEGLRYVQSLIANGLAEAGIVGCTNMGKLNQCAFHYKQMGRLNEDGKTKCFSDDADGYARSEACTVIFLQRKEDAYRVYGTLIETMIGDNFNKDLPLGDLNGKAPVDILRKSYEKFPDIRNKVSYIECSGEALKYWDEVELNSISEVLLEGREKPLLIGSIKSIIGHSEDAAAGVALVKALYSFDKGIVPPNLHYSTANRDIPALVSGKMKVVTEPTKLEGDFIGVNTYNVEGSLSHVIIKRNSKVKKIEPKIGVLPNGLPRLFVASARNEQGIKYILKKVEEMPIDEEFIALGHKLFRNVIRQYAYRGYTILNENCDVVNEIKEFNIQKRPIWFVFSGMGSQWIGMGTKLMKIPIFANAIYKCHEILKHHGVNLIDVITTTDETVFDNILNSFVGIAAIQIGLVDILNAIGLIPDGILGHSVGELGCAYADGCFTAEQMILAAYARGKASIDADLIPGIMAAVGMGYNDIKYKIPDGIDVACHNSSTSCTLSGPTKLMEEYIATVKAKGIFAKLVNASNIAYHSRYIQPAAPALLESLKKVIPTPMKRTSKWISSSVPVKDWDTETAMYSSAEYHTNNLLGSVLFEEASHFVPKNAIVVEIAPHGLLQAILKKSLPNAQHISLTHRAESDSVIYLLTALGKLYLEGVGLDIDKLYPPVEFPVSRGTPSYEPFVFWNHNLEVTTSLAESKDYSKNIIIDLNNGKYSLLKEYSVNGQPFIPSSVYLDVIIDHFQTLNNTSDPIVIEGFKVKCNPKVTEGQCQLYLCFQHGLGKWELCQQTHVVSKGQIMPSIKEMIIKRQHSVNGIRLSKEEIYNYLSSNGIELGPSFRLIQSLIFSDEEGTAEVLWDGNWISFMDNILLLPMLLYSNKIRKLKLLYSIQRLVVDRNQFNSQSRKVFKVFFDKKAGFMWSEGFEILYPQLKSVNVPERSSKELIYKSLQFLPYAPTNTTVIEELLEYSIEILIQNIKKTIYFPKINIIEVVERRNLHQQMLDAIKKRDGIKVDVTVVGSIENLRECDNEDEYDCTLVVNDSKDIDYSIKLLKKIKNGYLLLLDQTPPSSLATVLEQKKGPHTFFLCKLNSNFNGSSNFVMLSDPCWRIILEKKLSSDNKVVYVVGSSVSLPNISKIVEECDQISNSTLIRYVFFDEDSVTFDLSKYKSQLLKDMKINIHQNGEWGTFGLKSNVINTIYHTVDKQIFPFSNLRCHGTKLNAIGINLADVSGRHKKIGVIEYVGEKNGEKICGLATFLDDSQTLHPDKQLCWTKPKTWSEKEIASVLLVYSMAYYILKVDNHLEKGVKIYVSQGVHPLSQALITLAVKSGLEVFTSYQEVAEREWIKYSFPEIPEDNLLNLNHKQVDATVQVKTNGKNLKVVVNTLPEAHMVATSIEMVGYGGKFYQISLSPTKLDETIGMFPFLRQLTSIGLSPESFMLIPYNLKKKVRNLVTLGLQSGDIKPLQTIEFTSEVLNIDVVSSLMDDLSKHKKVTVNIENQHATAESFSSYYTALPDKSYLIIGDKSDFWIHLCHWLITRGARNIFIILRKYAFTCPSNQQFNNLVQLNPSLNMHLLSLERIKDKNSVSTLLEEINCLNHLAAVFVVGKENEETVKNLCGSKEKFLIVSLCAGGEAECEARAACGLTSLAICASNDLLKSHLILPVLDTLLTQKKPVVFISELKGTHAEVHDLTIAEYFQSLPSTPADILQLVNNSKKASWKEVRTNGFKTIHSREIDPVFILPSLKRSHMENLIRSLLNPAYEAKIPSDLNEISIIAEQLAEAIMKFKQNEITLICSDWAWSLGFAIAKFLEEEDKTVSIIALDSLAKRASKSVIRNYISDIKMKSIRKKEENISLGLKILEIRLDFMDYTYTICSNKYKGFLHIVKPDSQENYSINQLQQQCERPIRIHSIPSTNFSSMLSETKTANIVNSLILFEHKTAGRKLNKNYFENSVIEHAWKSALGLQRIQ